MYQQNQYPMSQDSLVTSYQGTNYQHQNSFGSNPPLSRFGTDISQLPPSGNMYAGGMQPPSQFNTIQNPGQGQWNSRQKSPEEVIQAMAQKIMQQGPRINTIADFFMPFDAHEQRFFESWEVAMIFADVLTKEDVDNFFRTIGQRSSQPGSLDLVLSFQTLVSQLMSKLSLPPGAPARQSHFVTKFKNPQTQSYLNHIITYFTQRSLSFNQGFDTLFRSPYVSQQDFQNFLQQVNLMIQPHETNQLFQYFLIGNESLISKISFVQALKTFATPQQLQTIPSLPSQISQPPFQQMDSFGRPVSTISANGENPIMQQFIQAVITFMNKNNGLSFETLLQRLSIPLSVYIDPSKFEELCLKVNLLFNPQELQILVNILDEDRQGKVKTSALRARIEASLMNSMQTINPFVQGNLVQQQPYNTMQTPSTVVHQSSFHINMQPMAQPTGGNNIQPFLDKIRAFLQQLGYTSMNKLFTVSFLMNKEVVELQDFLNFLQVPGLQLSPQDSFIIAQQFLVQNAPQLGWQTQKFIDLEAFQKAVFSNNTQQVAQTHNSYMVLSKIYESIRKYIMVNGGDIMKFFKEVDLNKDNFMSKAEMKIVLEKLGHSGISDGELNEVYMIFDQNKDGRISYAELCKQFSEFSNTKAIKDSSHWSYYIFETLRRACTVTQRPLADLFGMPSAQIKSLQDKVPISKDQFFQALQRLNVPLTPDYEKKLLELLDADAAHQWSIDFVHFAELVGIHYSPVQFQGIINQEMSQTPLQAQYLLKVRKFYRFLFDVLQSRNVTVANLQLIMKALDPRNEGLVPQQDFLNRLQSIDMDRKLDMQLVKEMSDKFMRQPGFISYMDFLKKLEFEFEKYKIIDYIFLTLQAAMQRLNISNLYDLFTKFDRSGGLRSFDQNMLNETLISLGMNLSKFELDMVMLEYDLAGTGQRLDFSTFEQEFKEFASGKSMLNAFILKRNNQYSDFISYIGQPAVTDQIKNLNQIHQPIGVQPNQPISRQATSFLVQEILKKIGRYIDSNPQTRLTQIFLETDVQKTGLLFIGQFQSLVQRYFLISPEEAHHLVQNYDPQQRQQIRTQDFLNDLKDYVNDMGMRMQVVTIAQEFGMTGASQKNLDPQAVILRYKKDLEDAFKAIIVRRTDTFRWFQNYAQSQSNPLLGRTEFRNAFHSLNLATLKPQDIDALFDALDSQRRGAVDIYTIDDVIRKTAGSLEQMQTEIIERMIKAFNGDDAYLLKELLTLDPSKRGFVEQSSFIKFIQRSAPSYVQLSETDLQFIAMKYSGTQNTQVDINVFHSDFKRIRVQRGMQDGIYNPNLGGNQPINSLNNYNGNIGNGHRNPLLPQQSGTMTRAEMQGLRAPPGFVIQLDPMYVHDLIKACYIREILVQDHFTRYGQKMNNGLLQETDFNQAIRDLGLEWTINSIQNVFAMFDSAFNGQYSRKMYLSPDQIDQAVAFGAKMNIDQMHEQYVSMIAQKAQQLNMNIRGELQLLDSRYTKEISYDMFRDLILNKVRVPQIMPFDLIFLSKRYISIQSANMIQYEKFLDDLQMKSGPITQNNASVGGASRTIADYIKKGCLVQKLSIDEHFQKFMKMRDLLALPEFQEGCQKLGLLLDVVQNPGQIEQFFKEMDDQISGRVTIGQISNYVSKLSTRHTRELQDEIIEIIVRKYISQNQMIDNIFKQDDVMNRGIVPLQVFSVVLQRTFQCKEIDAKLVGQRYIEKSDTVNYKMFIQECRNKEKDVRMTNNAISIVPGLNQDNQTNPAQQKLKAILISINDFVTTNQIQLVNVFAQYERGMSNGTIPQSSFLQSLDQINVPLTNNDKYFVAENYAAPQPAGSFGTTQQPQVDYRKFLEDLKFHAAAPPKSMNSLTKEQSELYTKFKQHLSGKGKSEILAQAIMERDIGLKGYLVRPIIEDVFIKCGYKFNSKQFNTLFSALEANKANEYNYKQMFEILFGQQEANMIFSGGNKRIRTTGTVSQFVMPNQSVGAMNAIMAEIGRKMIASNINYEEEIKKRIGVQMASSPNPRMVESDIIEVLERCRILLNNDERIQIQAFVMNKRDQQGYVSALEFLQSVGLPAQTLGQMGKSGLPKRILKPQELKMAQDIIFKLRAELNRVQKKPQDIFEKCKTSNQDLSIPLIKFKLTLASEFGAVGQSINDDQISLLAYYLTQEVPNEISYKKLYLAFTLTERDPPLTQQGSEEIRRYETSLKDKMKSGVPLEIIDLVHWMKQSGVSMAQIFKQTQKGLIARQEFETSLKEAGFIPKDPQRLIEILDIRGTRTSVSLDKLNEFIRKASSTAGASITPQMARERFQGFDPKVRAYLQKISDYLKRNNISIQKMYEEMDINRDGSVDKLEFVTKLSYLQIPGLQMSDLGMIYEALDLNNDGQLSVNEFGMFLEGAKASRSQRMQDLDPKIIEEMKREIQQLFSSFDENGDGYVTCDEIMKSMLALGQRITIDDAKQMIASVDTNNDGRVDLKEFTELMMPRMKEELLNQEDSLEDLRALFLDADIDHSGSLSLDEIYAVILKLGAEVSIEELVELMNEIDVDKDCELDIDEFIAFMNMGDEIQFRNPNAKNTYINIKKARKLNPMDFFKCFKNMPLNFVPSFISEKWNKQRKNLPSSVFMPQIDPKTMLYKDLFPVLTENLNPQQQQRAFQPRLRPLPTELGCEISLDEAQGVPLPQQGSGFDRTQIVKRSVRVSLYDTVKKDFIINAVQVNALYNNENEDIWQFNALRDNGTNPVLFKASNKDDVLKPHIFVVFEMVIYVKFGEKIQEISCGWCQLDMHQLDKAMTHRLPIKGGSPNAELLIKDQDVSTNRTGIKYISKVFSSKIDSQLTVQVRPHTKFTDETKFHLDLLPSTCFIQKRLLYFVSGFRNYLGEKLIKESSSNTFKHPEGDVIISCFSKIIDNPDICEQLITIWSEDVWSTLNARQKLNFEHIMLKTKQFIQKLYPVLYADEFKFKESQSTGSASGDQYLLRKREELIKSALRFGNANAKTKVDKPVELLTSFKPFTVRELEFEVWDTAQAKQDRFMKQYEDMGLLGGNNAQDQFGLNPLGNNTMLNNLGGAPPVPMQQIGGASFGQASQGRSLGSALNNAFGQR